MTWVNSAGFGTYKIESKQYSSTKYSKRHTEAPEGVGGEAILLFEAILAL